MSHSSCQPACCLVFYQKFTFNVNFDGVWWTNYESESGSAVSNSVTPWTIQCMEFSRPEYWSGSLSFLQGIFPTQGPNPGLLHCRWILYQLSHKGSLRILEWVAYPFSSNSSQPRTQTRVSCIAGGFFTNWAIREAQLYWIKKLIILDKKL